MTNRPEERRRDRESARREIAGLAAILSFLVPGLGHVLIGAWLRAAVWFAGLMLVSDAGGGGVHPIAVALMFVAGVDVLLYVRAGDRP